MQQRRVRLGDILDDYCPRERRITNHAVVAMIEDTVKQTRCTTCDADHEYRDGKAPSPRRRKAAVGDSVLVSGRARPVLAAADTEPELEGGDEPTAVPALDEQPEALAMGAAADGAGMIVSEPDADADVDADADADGEPAGMSERDEWPVHRPLIRATLPRPEGQVPERKATDFTVRPASGRFDPQRNVQHKGGQRPARQAQGQPGQGRFGGGPRTGSGHGSRQGAGPGQGPGHGQGQRPGGGNRAGANGNGNRPAQSRGPRQGGGGRKRGR